MSGYDGRALGDDLRRALVAKARQNEILVHRFRVAFLAALLCVHLAGYVRPFMPFPVTPGMLAYEAALLALAVGLRPYLRREDSVPRPAVFSVLDTTALGGFLFLHFLPLELASLLYYPCAFILILIAVSALRYSPGAVLASGVSGAAIFGAYFVARAGVRIEVVPGLVGIAVATVAGWFSSRTLLSLFLDVQRKARLERFLSPQIVAEIGERADLLDLAGARRRVTILFCDVRGFTGISERLDPSELVRLLNSHLTAMADVVFRHAGTLDKFLGDGLMAVFGAPIAREDDADRAVEAAVGMLAELERLNRDRAGRGEDPIRIGIGLHTGDVIAGTVGSPRRMEYTVIGDAVNVAARVESLTRKFDADLLVTEETRASLARAWPMRALGTERVKGRTAPVTVFAVEPTSRGIEQKIH